MTVKSFADNFKEFCAVQYGVSDPSHLPERQRLEIEDAFYAGVSQGFYVSFRCNDKEVETLHKELQAFGERIVERYKEAGLPLGVRRS